MPEDVRLIAVTKPLFQVRNKDLTADELIGYIARVSNLQNQESLDTIPKLIAYCVKHHHWSIFEQVDMTVEIVTSRAIAQQIVRHRSFCFQEFSQRYSEAQNFDIYDARRQDDKNRQNSVDDLSMETTSWFHDAQREIIVKANELYDEALKKGIAKECARFLLPLNTQTRLYMKGSVRSWIHYLEVRTDHTAQLEHREIASKIKNIFIQQFPLTAKALEWESSLAI